ncbi:AAA-like domain-containing protein [Chryseobacterium hagamense]|uniref:Uncharacterized protein n=1 Tax=Chryseobacterium hagamense TaxID=395935 RepID=A0A511YRS7_9FLAO|nr:AAA-like domain-containing protein [Chryseobacterium hagamense]GEN77897.1 hypothetical protein CHA01nite_36370 [Chryseobacterium hagamense]
MEKILKPYTIIPESLYVQRDADKQVESIIADMGRPGYVLVSRQMGKTNLLLHAKSKLERNEDAFVYVDLSNIFETAKGCFQNIVDTAIDSYEKFDSVAEIIYRQRKELNDIPPHKQHTNELRLLLEAVQGGKLVIILDEIDALTKTSYSDQIFSQIRSMYFAARVNYKGFNNLTYILSGVVEPNEIIKDPKVSPFNIGQKIYLNDFSKKEFLDFLKIAKLNLNEDSINRIYYWTHGNPRMTWDVCADIESAIENIECSPNLVDNIVEKLYLKSYDKAPIDNIRELVSKDKELRNSIVEISYGNGKSISDKIKSKLYLSGIINYNDRDIIIKNQIIAEALSLGWIRSIEENEKGFINTALDYISQENYEEAFIAFEKYLEDNEFDEEESSLYYYYIGLAAFRTNKLEEASKYLEKSSFDKEDESKVFFNLHYIKGLVYYYRNMIEESLDALKIVIDGKKNDEIYLRALINYGSFSMVSKDIELKLKAQCIFESIAVEELPEKIKANESFVTELKSVAFYNLGVLANMKSDSDLATEYFYRAYEITNGKKASVIIALINIVDDYDERYKLIEGLANLIIDNKIKPSEINVEKPLDFSYEDFKELILLTFSLEDKTLFKRLVPYTVLLNYDSVAQCLYEISLINISKNHDWDGSIELLYDIYENRDNPLYNLTDNVKGQVIKLLAYTLDINTYPSLFEDYIECFEKDFLGKINFFDFGIFHKRIQDIIENKNYSKALYYVELIKSVSNEVSIDLKINYLLIYHHELNIFSYINDLKNGIAKASQILELSSKYKLSESELLSINNKNLIKKNAEKFLFIHTDKVINKQLNRKYGRNDKIKVLYKNGNVDIVKFKKIEADLKKGQCIVID